MMYRVQAHRPELTAQISKPTGGTKRRLFSDRFRSRRLTSDTQISQSVTSRSPSSQVF
jgi:hypothetical protein